MQGFGVHTFRLVTAEGRSTFVKFHWKPLAGVHSVVWEEAQAISGLDPDFHRRDLWNSIENGQYPQWELGVQLISEEDQERFDFDLLDPTKLVSSARRIFGDDMERLWGEFASVPADRLRILEDGDCVRAGDIEVRAIETPGHASHHHVYQWEDNVFGGDVAGVRLGNGPPIPPFVPPELNIELWRESIARIRALDPARLLLPHFGPVQESIAIHLDALDERVARWSEWFRERLRGGDDEAKLRFAFADYEAHDLRAGGASAEDVRDYEHADPSFMAVPANVRYWLKFHPEEMTP